MAIQSTVSEVGDSLTFPSTKAIATKQHMAVWVFNDNIAIEPPYFGWEQVNIYDFDLVNNAAVILDPNVLVGRTLIEIRVADSPNELEYSPSVISIIAAIAQEIVVVACMAYEVVVVANNITSIQLCADSITDINICAANIQEIIDAPVYSESAKQASWRAEAEALTSDSYAQESEDVLVKEYTSNGDGTFTATDVPGTFSSFHWMQKTEKLALGFIYQGEWDASVGAYPTTRPPEGTGAPLTNGDTFNVIVEGTIDGILWEVGDFMVHVNGTWGKVSKTVDWANVINVPSNVTNAVPSLNKLVTGDDLDIVNTQSITMLDAAHPNMPLGAEYGTLLVAKSLNGDTVTQTIVSSDGLVMWTRGFTTTDGWSTWGKYGSMVFDGTTLEITI